MDGKTSPRKGCPVPLAKGKHRLDIDAEVYAEAAAAAEKLHVSTTWLITALVREGLQVKRGGAWQMLLLLKHTPAGPEPSIVPLDDDEPVEFGARVAAGLSSQAKRAKSQRRRR